MQALATIETANGVYVLSRLGEDRWAVTTPHNLRPVEFTTRVDAEAWIGRPLQRVSATDVAAAA